MPFLASLVELSYLKKIHKINGLKRNSEKHCKYQTWLINTLFTLIEEILFKVAFSQV